jgi:hypothetical protein
MQTYVIARKREREETWQASVEGETTAWAQATCVIAEASSLFQVSFLKIHIPRRIGMGCRSMSERSLVVRTVTYSARRDVQKHPRGTTHLGTTSLREIAQ